jgi:rhodanese-related sulfurtransferase
VDKREGAHGIFHSLHDKLLALASDTEVWPGHLGGSLCGGPGMDMKVCSTIGYESRHNELLHERDEDAFVNRAVGNLPPQPPNFKNVVEINRGPLVTAGVDLMPLTSRQVEERRTGGALLVDVRTDFQFDEAHIPGAVSNTMLRAGFGTKLAWIANPEQEVVFIGRDDQDGYWAARLAVAVGVRNLGGYLHGGMTSWRAEGRDVGRVERIDVPELHERNGSLLVLDVREDAEWRAGHIPDSLHVPYHDIHSLPDGMDPSQPVAVVCASGQRSAVAASLLKAHGADEVIHVVDGGVPLWERLGFPIERA